MELIVSAGRVTAMAVLALVVTGCGGRDAEDVDDEHLEQVDTSDDSPHPTRSDGPVAGIAFHPVLGPADGASGEGTPPAGGGEVVLENQTGERLLLGPAELTGDHIERAEAVDDADSGRGWLVEVEFNGEGEIAWQQLTAEAACYPPGDPLRHIAIVLDAEIISAPQVNTTIQCDVGLIGSETQITGDFDAEEAQNLADRIGGG